MHPREQLTLFTAAVLQLSKDTSVSSSDGVMRAGASGNGPVVKVGSVDTGINGSTLVTADGQTVRMRDGGCNAEQLNPELEKHPLD